MGALLFALGVVAEKRVSHFHYIPGMELRDYAEGARVNVSVNSLHSHEALVSLDYYSMPFCGRTRKVEAQEQNYGQVLWGDKIESSEYHLKMMKPTNCGQIKCSAGERWLPPKSLALFETRINNGYRGNFVIDNLPVSAPQKGRMLFDREDKHCHDTAPRGWALGVTKKCHGELTLIHNHLIFNVTVNKHQDNRYIIVGVKVIPFSVDWAKMEGGVQSCTNAFNVWETKIVPLTTTPHEEKGTPVYWTFGVEWTVTEDVDWSNRWDEYLNLALSNSNQRSHWASIINSFLIVLCLSAIVAMILLRTLHMDFNRYNASENSDEQAEEMGWKLVHGDVFRRPSYPGVFAVIVGTGFQLLGMFALCIILALFGYLSPAFRGGLITVAMLVFVLMAVLNGIVTGYVLNMFEKREWKLVFLAGLGYPTVLFAPWVCMELFLLSRPGANTAPIVAVVEMMGLWFGVSLPLIILGAGIGFRVCILAICNFSVQNTKSYTLFSAQPHYYPLLFGLHFDASNQPPKHPQTDDCPEACHNSVEVSSPCSPTEVVSGDPCAVCVPWFGAVRCSLCGVAVHSVQHVEGGGVLCVWVSCVEQRDGGGGSSAGDCGSDLLCACVRGAQVVVACDGRPWWHGVLVLHVRHLLL